MSTQTSQRRPQPIPRTGANIAPDGKVFVWGAIVAVHTVGDVAVVEYLNDRSDFAQESAWAEHGKTMFQPFIGGRDTCQSAYSLDSALVLAITIKRCGPNSQAAHHFDLMTLGVLPDGDQP